MVVVDGTKYACQRCIRGHRVSGCNHYKEELHIVKRKGRPSAMCLYCRRQRQSRTIKIRCLCSGPTAKCASATCRNAHLLRHCTCTQTSGLPEIIPAGKLYSTIASYRGESTLNTVYPEITDEQLATPPGYTKDQLHCNSYPLARPLEPVHPLSPPDSVGSSESENQVQDARGLSSASASVLENLSMNSLSSVNDVVLRPCASAAVKDTYPTFQLSPTGRNFEPHLAPRPATTQMSPPSPLTSEVEFNRYHIPHEVSPMSYLYG